MQTNLKSWLHANTMVASKEEVVNLNMCVAVNNA